MTRFRIRCEIFKAKIYFILMVLLIQIHHSTPIVISASPRGSGRARRQPVTTSSSAPIRSSLRARNPMSHLQNTPAQPSRAIKFEVDDLAVNESAVSAIESIGPNEDEETSKAQPIVSENSGRAF
jgi:hypothetical protein